MPLEVSKIPLRLDVYQEAMDRLARIRGYPPEISRRAMLLAWLQNQFHTRIELERFVESARKSKQPTRLFIEHRVAPQDFEQALKAMEAYQRRTGRRFGYGDGD